LAERPTVRATVVLAVVAALQILAGSGDMVVLTALAAPFLLAETLWDARREGLARAALLRIAVAVFLALGISAAQWIPTAAIARTSLRARMPPEAILYWSVHPASLAELVLPQAWPSLPLSESVRAALFESREPFLRSLYLGLTSLFLLLPLARFAGPRRAAVLILGVATFILAALGSHTPLLPLMLRMPGLSLFRYPVKYTIVAGLFWALAAGLGLEAWLRPWSSAERRTALRVAWVAAVAACVTLAAAEALRIEAPRLGRWVSAPSDWRPSAYAPLVWKLRRASVLAALCGLVLLARRRRETGTAASLAAAALVAMDVLTAARGVNDLASPELAAYRPPVLELLAGPSDEHRLFSPAPSMAALNRSLVRGPAGWPQAWSLALGVQQTLPAPLGARWGLRGSFDPDFTGLGSPAFSTLSALVARYEHTPVGLRLLRMGGVTEVVSLRGNDVPGTMPIGELRTVFTETVHLARVPASLPRAYVVAGTRVERGDDAWRALGDPDFDLATTVLLDEDGGRASPGPAFRGLARVMETKPGYWRVITAASAPGYLVVTEANAPGWRAAIDGRPTDVRTANILFRCVAVPAGLHAVTMSYRPISVSWGLSVSGVAIVIAAAALAIRRPEARTG
jgi:hypothetical protein